MCEAAGGAHAGSSRRRRSAEIWEESERRCGGLATKRRQEDGELRQMRTSPSRAGGSQADRGGRRVPLLGKEQWKRLALRVRRLRIVGVDKDGPGLPLQCVSLF